MTLSIAYYILQKFSTDYPNIGLNQATQGAILAILVQRHHIQFVKIMVYSFCAMTSMSHKKGKTKLTEKVH